MAADENLTTSRLLNRLAHDIDTKAAEITVVSADRFLVYDASVGKFGYVTSGDLTLTDLGAIAAAVVVGEDDTGYDVTFFGATSGKKMQWDESADTLIVDGDISLTGSLQNDKTTAVTADSTPATLTFTGGLNLVSNTTDANDIVDLPVNAAGDIGKEIELYAVEGFELQSADASATLNDVLIGATNECAIAAGTYVRLKCVADNTWLSIISTLDDGTQTQLVPDAA